VTRWRWAVRDYDEAREDANGNGGECWRAIDPLTFKSTGYNGNPELVATDSDEPTWARTWDEGEAVLSAGGGEYTPYSDPQVAVRIAALGEVYELARELAEYVRQCEPTAGSVRLVARAHTAGLLP
jgi:hypothetical protein